MAWAAELVGGRRLGPLVPLLLLAACGLRERACSQRTDKTELVARGSALREISFENPIACEHRGPGRDLSVGPGKAHATLGDVPWESLGAGDTVRIFHRPEPYREKVVISGVGRPDAPIRVCGVRGPGGALPVIDGDGATTRPSMEFPYDGHQARGLVVVGRRHSSPWAEQPEHVVIEGLEIRGARPPNRFKDRAGRETAFAENAAGIFVQRARHVTVRGCVVHDNANGFFMGTGAAEELTRDVLLEGNYVHDNGSPETYYQHNVYNEVSGVTYQHNRFGPPKGGPKGILGANVKERSAGVVMRYNWIEDGAHLVDLVDAQEARADNLPDPRFHESWVYGNVLVRGPVASGSMVHYGGDSGLLETYRKGTLHFFHNTVVVLNASHDAWQGTSVFELSTNEEALALSNNVLFSEAPGARRREVALLGPRDGVVSGIATLQGNWLSEGFVALAGAKTDKRGEARGFDGARFGRDPGFLDLRNLDLRAKQGAPITGAGATLDSAHPVDREYVPHGQTRPRRPESPPTPGAFSAE